MRASLLLLCVLPACTYEWNGQAPPFPLTGPEPSLSSFEKLNGDMPVGVAELLVAPDAVPWAEFCEDWGGNGTGDTDYDCLQVHLTRLSPAGQARVDEDWQADQFALLGPSELLIAHDDPSAQSRTVTLHRPGDAPAADVSFSAPIGKAHVHPSEDGNAIAYLPEATGTTQLYLYRRDPVFSRALPLPDASGERPGVAFNVDASRLVVQGADGHTLVYAAMAGGTDADLGTLPQGLVLDGDDDVLLAPATGGVGVVPLDGSAARTLTGGSGALTAPIGEYEGVVYFTDEQGLWQVPFAGGAATLDAAGAARLLAIGPALQLVYSHDPAEKYANGAGDGWIGSRKIMERGIYWSFSGDGTRFRWLEHGATLGAYGDLTTIELSSGSPETLALNCYDYAELPDGRVLAVENAVFGGTWNRLVVIDEAAQTKHWVSPSTEDFVLTPSGTEIVADVVSGASGYDILRVPAPPQAASP